MGILDTVIDKTKGLMSEYDQRKRAEKEDWLNVKEEKLDNKEKLLSEQEQALQKLASNLAKKEKELLKKQRKPLYVFLACLFSVGFFFSYLLQNYEFIKRIAPEVPLESSIKQNANDMPSERVDSAVESCISRGVLYFKEIGSYPTLTSAPSTGRRAESVAKERCERTVTAF